MARDKATGRAERKTAEWRNSLRLPLAAAFKRVSSPFRSFPVFACGLSAGVHWKSPYRFKWVGGSAAHCVYAKAKTRLCLTALKSVFWFFLGYLPKRTPFYYCVDMKTEVIGGNVSSPEINTIFYLRRQSCNNRYQLL